MKHFARNILKHTGGSVLMEYVIITGVFLLVVGGAVYIDSKYVNLFTAGMPGNYAAGSAITADSVPAVVEEASTTVEHYGLVGNKYSSQVKLALKVIASPLP